MAQRVALLSPAEREEALDGIDKEALLWDPKFWLRPSQLLPLIQTDWNLGILRAGRGYGKQIDVSTRIPTPSGWITMGAIRDGDEVLDEAGLPCRVLKAHDIETPERAYHVRFSDGTWIDAGGEHQWVTWTHRERKQYMRSHPGAVDFPEDWPTFRQPIYRAGKVPTGETVGPEIRDTEQILKTLQQETARADLNHCIPVTGVLELPDQRLPIDPWVLGYWLGNGTTRDATIHAGSKDGEFDGDHVAGCLAAAGFEFSRRDLPDKGQSRFGVRGLLPLLRASDLLHNKHVPPEYLRAGPTQRLALLRGLMDSDGHAATTHHVEFSSTSEQLAHGVLELVRTLSERPVLSVGRASLDGRDMGPKYRVTWRPSMANPFALARKARDVEKPGAQGIRLRHRMITAIEPIEPIPMRCLTVDSPNSMYLVGEGMIPTHNTRVLSEWTRMKVKDLPAGSRGALVARTAADVRDVLVNGQSGIIAMSPEDERPTWEPSKRLLTFPNGTTCLCFTSEAPDALRGPQFHFLVADEIASWLWLPDESGLTAWDNARLATRLGENPQILAATTPRRTPFMRALMELTKDPRTLLIRGSTRDNEANLAQVYLDTIYGLYGGTRLAAQELEGEMLEDAEHALWKQELIDSVRLPDAPEHVLRVCGVDPSVAERPTDECGIVVAGSTSERELHRRHAYVLEDASILGAPSVWAQRVVDVCERWNVRVVVAEGNQGAALVADAIRSINPNLRVEIVHARVNKATRAEPVAVRYDKGQVHHIGVFPELESQMTAWEPADKRGKSPDRIDALVWAITALLIKPVQGMMGGELRSTGVTRRRLTTGSLSGGRGFGADAAPSLSEVMAAHPSVRSVRGGRLVRSVGGARSRLPRTDLGGTPPI